MIVEVPRGEGKPPLFARLVREPNALSLADCTLPLASTAKGKIPIMQMKIAIGVLLCLFVLTSRVWGSCREESFAAGFLPRAYAASADATIKYFGHNFFQVISGRGTRIVTDPLAPGWYPLTIVPGDVVTISREHENHNWTPIVTGNPLILRGLVETESGYDWNKIRTNVKDVLIYNVPTYNKLPDDRGLYRGAAFVFDLGVLCIAHLGDLSHELTPAQLKQFGKIDIALTPIGGWTTMGPETARAVVRQLQPKIAIPMHYRDDLERVREFADGFPLRYLPGNTLELSQATLPSKTQIIVMGYPGGP